MNIAEARAIIENFQLHEAFDPFEVLTDTNRPIQAEFIKAVQFEENYIKAHESII